LSLDFVDREDWPGKSGLGMKIGKGQTLLFIGDSITDCGRARPLGERAGLGTGYVSLVDSLIAVNHPGRKIRVLNTGIGGNRVTDLEHRWEADVVAHAPGWLSIMIGINDVWRQFDHPRNPVQVDEARFGETLERIIRSTRRSLAGVVLMTPFYLEKNRDDPMRKRMDEYGEIVRDMAVRQDAILVDVQAGFDHYLRDNPTQSLCGDRVHPNLTGHMVIAKCFLDAVGFTWR
jgi:lysophospholipase L1-like esterase